MRSVLGFSLTWVGLKTLKIAGGLNVFIHHMHPVRKDDC